VKVKKAVIGIVLSILSGGVLLTGCFLAYLLVFSSIFNSGDIPHKSDPLPLACDEYERLSPGLELLTVGAKRLRSFN